MDLAGESPTLKAKQLSSYVTKTITRVVLRSSAWFKAVHAGEYIALELQPLCLKQYIQYNRQPINNLTSLREGLYVTQKG